jgi:hypothetical protein
MITYRITIVIGKMDNSICPPPLVAVLFPNALPLTVSATEQDCLVTFAEPQTPADLGPLVKVEIIPNP